MKGCLREGSQGKEGRGSAGNVEKGERRGKQGVDTFSESAYVSGDSSAFEGLG